MWKIIFIFFFFSLFLHFFITQLENEVGKIKKMKRLDEIIEKLNGYIGLVYFRVLINLCYL